MSYLVDTNIISELSRLHPNAGVLNWAQAISRFAISVISLDEIFFGLAWHPNARVRSWIQGFFQRHEVLSVDETVARRAGGTARSVLMSITSLQ